MNKANEQFEISEILSRAIAGELNEEEQEKLRLWLEASERHRDLYHRLCSPETAQQKAAAYKRLDSRTALDELLREKALRRRLFLRRRLLRMASAAAVVALVITVGAYFYIHRSDEKLPLVQNEIPVIRAGKPKAILTLASGETMKLSEKTPLQIEQEGLAVIRSDSGLLQYQVTAENPNAGARQYNRIEVPRGGEFTLALSDGTKVWLNADSRLRYPVAFTGETRQVYLEGEAYFEVSHDARHAFIVSTDRANVTVYGTSFNVMDYAGEQEMQVTLVNGSVGVDATAGGHRLKLLPGEQATLESGRLSKERVNVSRYVSWREGKVVYVSTPLEEMMREMARWYDVDIVFVREQARHILFTGEFIKYDDFNEVLDVLRTTQEVNARVEGRTVMIY